MPSPAGHLVAGAAIAWAAEAMADGRANRSPVRPVSTPLRPLTPLVAACAVLALAPDLDLLLASHRTVTHSIGAVAVTAVAGGAVARALGWPAVITAAACALTVASHVVLDWLGKDSNTPRGVMALWPLSTAYFYSGVDLFAEVSRRYWKPDEFIVKNAFSVAREILILGPIAAATFWWRGRRRLSVEADAPTSSTTPTPRDPGTASSGGETTESRARSPELRRSN
jgi:membrane-bound metal-dependent hydrolase YbcI (DUF457 family)